MVYSRVRSKLGDIDTLSRELQFERIELATRTKYSHWSYESEERVFVKLDEVYPDKNMYFYSFSPDIILKEVVLGSSFVGSADVVRKLINPTDDVDIITTRLAFQSYKVVTQNNPKFKK